MKYHVDINCLRLAQLYTVYWATNSCFAESAVLEVFDSTKLLWIWLCCCCCTRRVRANHQTYKFLSNSTLQFHWIHTWSNKLKLSLPCEFLQVLLLQKFTIPVDVALASPPIESKATAPTVSKPCPVTVPLSSTAPTLTYFSAVPRYLSATLERSCDSSVASSTGLSSTGNPIFLANFRAPSPANRQWGVSSMTCRARDTGLAMPSTQVTAPIKYHVTTSTFLSLG